MRLLVSAQHPLDVARGKAAYPARLGQTQVCFLIAPLFARPWLCSSHRGPGIWKLICTPPRTRPEGLQLQEACCQHKGRMQSILLPATCLPIQALLL